MKPRNITIKREAFETAGWRVISIGNVEVKFPDGTMSAVGIRLRARPGSDGDIEAVVWDLASHQEKVLRLKRAGQPMTKASIIRELRDKGEARIGEFRLAYNGNEDLTEGGTGRVWCISGDIGGIIEEHSSMERAAARLLKLASP